MKIPRGSVRTERVLKKNPETLIYNSMTPMDNLDGCTNPTKVKMTSLPTEILQEILLLVSDLRTLRRIIGCHPVLYAAFQGRRALILTSVLQRQLTKLDTGASNPSSCSTDASLKRAIAQIKKWESRRCSAADLLCFCKAAWPVFAPRRRPEVARSWGYTLFYAYEKAGRTADALAIGEEIWECCKQYPPTTAREVHHLARMIHRRIPTTPEREVRDVARTMLRLYRQAGRFADALHFQEAVLDHLDPKTPEAYLWATELSQAYRTAGRTGDELALQRRFLQAARLLLSDPNEYLRRARRLVRTHLRVGEVEKALTFQTHVLASLVSFEDKHMAWGRHMIHLLKRLKREEQALAVRAQVWSNTRPGTVGYYAWAHQLCAEYRTQRQEDQAVQVEEAVWASTRNMPYYISNDMTLPFHARAAGLSLVRTYRKGGKIAMAEQIERELSRARFRF